jgi:hypothetical protein
MLIVGTDRIRVVGSAVAPDGTRHAVDTDGRVLCRTSRARFAWPALTWEEQQGLEATCSLCIQVRIAQEALSQVPAYPVPSAAGAVPWQPTAGPLEADSFQADSIESGSFDIGQA